MKRMLGAAALTLSGSATAFGFDQAVQAIVERYKAQEPVAAADVGELMRQSAEIAVTLHFHLASAGALQLR